MRLQFKHQKFQADAAKAVVDVFAGQPYLTPTYMMDRGINYQLNLTDDEDFTGWRNEPIVPELADKIILERLNKIQRINQIEPSAKLERSESCKYNLTIEMETGSSYPVFWTYPCVRWRPARSAGIPPEDRRYPACLSFPYFYQ